MSILLPDIKASGAASAEINGYRFTLVYILDQVGGSNAIAQIYNALNDPLIPAVGTDLSNIHTNLAGCWLRDYEAELLSPGMVKVTMRYQHSPVEEVQIEAGSSLNHISSNKDKNNDAITLQYEYPDPFDPKPDMKGKTITQGGTFTKLVPERTLVYRLRETNSPQSFAKDYEGKVNNAAWQSGAAGTWLCASITGRSDNSGVDFVNTYAFQYREDGWDPEVALIDPITGKPPADLVANVGTKIVETYANADFTDMFPAA